MKTAMAGTAGAIWGLVGIFVLIGSAVYRLTSTVYQHRLPMV